MNKFVTPINDKQNKNLQDKENYFLLAPQCNRKQGYLNKIQSPFTAKNTPFVKNTKMLNNANILRGLTNNLYQEDEQKQNKGFYIDTVLQKNQNSQNFSMGKQSAQIRMKSNGDKLKNSAYKCQNGEMLKSLENSQSFVKNSQYFKSKKLQDEDLSKSVQKTQLIKNEEKKVQYQQKLSNNKDNDGTLNKKRRKIGYNQNSYRNFDGGYQSQKGPRNTFSNVFGSISKNNQSTNQMQGIPVVRKQPQNKEDILLLYDSKQQPILYQIHDESSLFKNEEQRKILEKNCFKQKPAMDDDQQSTSSIIECAINQITEGLQKYAEKNNKNNSNKKDIMLNK